MVTHDRDLASRVSRVILIADGEITDEHISSAFPLLNKAEQVQLFSKLEPVNYAPGTTIIKKGDPATHFYILVKGHAEVVLNHPTGGEMVVGHLEAGQFFGEMGILEGGRRTATVRAAADSEVVVMQLDREAFVGMVENSQLTGNQIAALIRQRTIASSLSQFVPAQTDMQAPTKDASAAEQGMERIDGLMTNLQDKWEIKVYQPGEVILNKDEPISGMYIISKGSVDILTLTEDNREVKVATLRVSEFFGARNSILQTHKGSMVRAANDSQVEMIFINQSHLENISGTEPEVEKSIVTMATTMRLRRSDILKAKNGA